MNTRSGGNTSWFLNVLATLVVLAAGGSMVATSTTPDSRGQGTKPTGPSSQPVAFPKIDRCPPAEDSPLRRARSIPKHNPTNVSPFEIDLRGCDLSKLDLSTAGGDLPYAAFDDRTLWPTSDRMPAGFDCKRIREMGKNPGLGVRSLHAQGITGRGVGIAIIDNPLLVDHAEYADRLRFYEENNVPTGAAANHHGPAVVSIAVGKTVGVAPQADLYYFGRFALDLNTPEGKEPPLDFQHDAKAIDRILQINEQLPEDRKIRVISISIGWGPGYQGYREITAAVERAKRAGMLVICACVEVVHGFEFHGLGRDPWSDPDDFYSYRPAGWARGVYTTKNRLLVPMEARTVASSTGMGEYVFWGQAGVSWSIPYLAGVYALAAQVEPKITPERFWALAMKTGRTIPVSDQGKSLDLGPILDPAQLIEAIRRGDLSDQATVAAELAKYRTVSPRNQPQAKEPKDRISEDFAARIARLDIDHAGRKDVIEQLGKPASYYILGNEVLDANNLPSGYTMIYPAGVQVIMSADRIARISISAPGYLFRSKIQVGTTLDEVFAVLGPPRKTVDNAKVTEASRAREDGVLYQDLNGAKGNCLYRDQSQGVILYFAGHRVYQVTLLPQAR